MHDVSANDLAAPRSLEAAAIGRLAAITAAAAAIGLVIGGLVAFGVGSVVFVVTDADTNNGWDTLGHLLIAGLFGAAAGVVAYLFASIRAVIRWVPSGQQTWPIIATIAMPPLLVLLPGLSG